MVTDVLERNNVSVSGNPDGRPMLFAHGFGCDQNMWRYVVPGFEGRYRTVLFDYLGAGGSDLSAYDPDRYSTLSAYDPDRYSTLDGYAADVLEICEALDLTDVVFVGHSVSSMVGVLASAAAPERFGALVLIGPSPRYIDDDGYVGGFTEDDIAGLLESLDSNYLGWSSAMAPVIMGNPDRPDLGAELTASFCRTDPEQELLAARLRAEESEARATALARTLQATFRPPAIVAPPGLDVGGAYRPAGDGSEVGGDFYDVFETGRGTWAVVLGDVCGKGLAAAVVTALARYSVRAEALRTPYPCAVLASLHDALVRYHPEQFCTALLVTIDRTAAGVRLTVSTGHHLPLRHRAGGFDTIGETGTILGMLDRPHLTDKTTLLAPGDLRRALHRRRHRGPARQRVLRRRTPPGGYRRCRRGDAQQVADAIVGEALDFQRGDARDDIAVVVIKVPGG